MSRPYVLLKVATSIDGYIDDTSPNRLYLSNAADFDRVDQVRAECDAILIGAGTLRADNPRLLIKSEARRAARAARGETEHLLKVTITGSGKLDPDLRFWHTGDKKLVYTTDAGAARLRQQLGGLADIVTLGSSIDFGALLDDLGEHGVRKLLVEGGTVIHTAFLSAGLADEIQMAITPLVIGDAAAPRFLNPASYPGAPHRRMRLVGTEQLGDTVLLRYAPKEESDEPPGHAWRP
ncbi:RibD family protein [Pseudonocardia acaciae]|uniref:RibD family protein n=1 Tax=Pseudonocardia acaciae TaxID=551276 RepID=UPI000491769F|nr:dihydrofolate reductase family protein [Pseudonocardia acaciae]